MLKSKLSQYLLLAAKAGAAGGLVPCDRVIGADYLYAPGLGPVQGEAFASQGGAFALRTPHIHEYSKPWL